MINFEVLVMENLHLNIPQFFVGQRELSNNGNVTHTAVWIHTIDFRITAIRLQFTWVNFCARCTS